MCAGKLKLKCMFVKLTFLKCNDVVPLRSWILNGGHLRRDRGGTLLAGFISFYVFWVWRIHCHLLGITNDFISLSGFLCYDIWSIWLKEIMDADKRRPTYLFDGWSWGCKKPASQAHNKRCTKGSVYHRKRKQWSRFNCCCSKRPRNKWDGPRRRSSCETIPFFGIKFLCKILLK